MQFLLGTEDGDEEHIPHALFTELDEICLREGEDAEWKETARYTASHMGWVWLSVTLVCFILSGCSFITDLMLQGCAVLSFVLNYRSK